MRPKATHGVILATVIAAIRYEARLAVHRDPVGQLSQIVLAGVRRSGAERGRGQIVALRWDEADLAVNWALQDGTLRGLQNAAMGMSDCLLRVGELAELEVRDVDLEASSIRVRRSKTDQLGEGVDLYLGERTLSLVKRWIQSAEIEEGPLFRPVRRKMYSKALTTKQARRIFTVASERIGLVGGTGHRARVGAAQSLIQCGASVAELQQAGGKIPRCPPTTRVSDWPHGER